MFEEYQEYFKNLESDKSENTIRNYRYAIDLFLDFFHIETCKKIERITRKQINEYRDHLLSSNTISTVNSRMRPVNAFFIWLADGYYINRNPLRGVKALKEGTKLPVYLSYDEQEKMINAYSNTADKLIIALLLATGMRRDEIVHVKLSDIDDNSILIHGKGNKERTVTVWNGTYELLKQYVADRKNKGEYLFSNSSGNALSGETIRAKVKKAAKLAGIEPDRIDQISCHKLRHSCATNLVDKDVPLSIIQDILGHASPVTTAKYAHVRDNKRDEALKKLG